MFPSTLTVATSLLLFFNWLLYCATGIDYAIRRKRFVISPQKEENIFYAVLILRGNQGLYVQSTCG